MAGAFAVKYTGTMVLQVRTRPQNKFMLVAVRKNCDRDLENAVRDRRPRAAFSSPSSRSQFFKIRSDPKPENNIVFFFFPAVNLF